MTKAEFVDTTKTCKPECCIIEPCDKEEKIGSIFMPDNYDNRQHFGYVMVIGETKHPVEFELGDCVVYDRRLAHHMHFDDGVLTLSNNTDVLCVVS